MTHRLAVLAAICLPATAFADEPPPAAPVTAQQALVRIVRPVEDPPPFPRFSTAPLELDVEVFAQARRIAPDGDTGALEELRLDRGEVGARVMLGSSAATELRVESIRSAADGGALGIDGDTTVIRIKRAQLVGGHSWFRRGDGAQTLRIDGAIGFIQDPWLDALERDDTLRPLARTGSEQLLAWPVSDLAAMARVTLGPARLAIAVGNGEGLAFPERNSGKTTTAVLEVVPLHTTTAHVRVSAVARDGSIGPALVRDRRFGGAATAVLPRVRGGAEVVKAYGLATRGELEGLLASGWIDARVAGDDRDTGLFVAARGATLGYEGGGRITTVGGAVAVQTWHRRFDGRGSERDGRFRIWLALDRTSTSGNAMPVPGADAGTATTVLAIASAVAPFIP
ncbi:MAG: hypothetical protein KF773_10315 [Deltaproteobacteria bacterium]|nr:hypothetical protein [Deltaproteobacteria bacterium]